MRNILLVIVAACAVVFASDAHVWAQAHNPFSVGISEGGGSASGLMGWIVSLQASFEHMLSAAVRDMRLGPSALPVLMAIGFVYGVLHAAGPGHGKAVIASYMLANERALRHGTMIAFAAAFVQGCVAVALVGVLALVVHASALTMRATAHMIELISFGCIAALGLWLIWRKGRAFWQLMGGPAEAGRAGRFVCEACEGDEAHVHGPSCGHVHMPDPTVFTRENYAWRHGVVTVLAAGARPCSGAILVLVFALAQGVFSAGIAATFAMSLGTALTTCSLAVMAVFAKDVAVRLFGRDTHRGRVIASGVELIAALVVFVFGVALFFGFMVMGA
jgi:nickel/cobalt transporter (NicO) family protein